MRYVVLSRPKCPRRLKKFPMGCPPYCFNGNLGHFAAFSGRYSFFPAPLGIDRFEKELAPYRSRKGTLRFPLDKPFPWALLKKVIRFRVKENTARVSRKR